MKTILVVDDNAVSRELLRETLEDRDHQVVEAACGHEALDVIAADPPDLVFLDLNMPGMDGFATLRNIRDHPLWARIPVVAVSGMFPNGPQTALAAGFDSFLLKPIDLKTLRRRSAELLLEV